MTNRAIKAIEVMLAGGYFRKALEASRPGWGEKFKTHLYDASGRKVHGIGGTTKNELADAGMLVRRECASSSTWPEEWAIDPGKCGVR
jgi:hypothetical protein